MNTPSFHPTIFLDAYAANDYGDGPLFATVQATPAHCARLVEINGLCAAHNLSEARTPAEPDAWGPGDVAREIRLADAELVVCDGSFWFQSGPKHADYMVETRSVRIDELLAAVTSGASPQYLGNDPAELEALVAEYARRPEETAAAGV